MLIPRFSLRWVLAVVGLCGVAFLFLSLAVSGSEWAAAITAVLLVLVVAAFCHAVLFAVVWLLSLLVGGLNPPAAERTPFRSETPARLPAAAAGAGGAAEGTAGAAVPPQPTD